MYGWRGGGFMGRFGGPGNLSYDYGTDYAQDSYDYKHDYGSGFYDFGYDNGDFGAENNSNSYKRPIKRQRSRFKGPIRESRSKREEQTIVFVNKFLFGGGFRLKENCFKHTKERNKTSEDKGQPAVKKMKTSAESEEPGSEEDDNAEEAAQSTMNDEDQEDGTQEEAEHTQSSSKEPQESQKESIGHNLVNSIQFFCTLCHFGTFHEEEMDIHQQSDFHKEHLSYVKNKLSKVEGCFLEAFLKYCHKKTKKKRKQLEDLSNTIHQIYRKHDYTLGLGIDHFVKKMDISHCEACDRFLPLHHSSLQSHLQSSAHKRNLKDMMKRSKRHAYKTALRILASKQNPLKLKLYKNGKNPFRIDDDDEEYIRIDWSRDSEGEESGEMPCITLSDSEEEEDDDIQGRNSFINNEEEDIKSHCSTEVLPETEESQKACSNPPDTERDEKNFQGQNSFINNNEEEEDIRSDYSAESAPEAEESPQKSFINNAEEEDTRSDHSAESAPEAEELPQNSFINNEKDTRSHYSVGSVPEAEESQQKNNNDEEEDARSHYSLGSVPESEESPQNSFINNEEEEEDTRSDHSAESVPEAEESPQMACSTPPDFKKEEDEPVPEQERAEDSS